MREFALRQDGRYLNASPDVLQHARDMRRSATDAERRLWSLLRNRQLGGARFRRQQPIGRYIVDFYCAEAKLVVEVDGGQHVEPEQVTHDAERSRALEAMGIRVLRVLNNDVMQNPEGVALTIANSLTPTLSLREREQNGVALPICQSAVAVTSMPLERP